MSEEQKLTKGISRRKFIQGAAIGTMGLASAGVLAGCSPQEASKSNTGSTAETSEITAWDTPPEAISDNAIKETVETEVLVVGAGNSGMMAALSAAEAGARVILIEKQPTYITRTYWMGAVNSSMQKKMGIEINRNEIAEELCRYASHLCDQRLINLWADKSGEMMDWLVPILEAGDLEVVLEYDTKEGFYPSYPIAHIAVNRNAEYKSSNALIGAQYYMPVLEKKAIELGVDIRYNTPLAQLVREGDGTGRVTGAIAKNKDEEYIKFNAAKGVIICTGGYARNPEMLQALCPDSLSTGFCIAQSGPLGEGIKAASWVGAALETQHTTMIFDRGLVPDGVKLGPPWEGTYWQLGSQPFLRVNVNGERYANEDLPYDFGTNAVLLQPERLWWQIFDDNWKEDVTRFHTTGCARIVNTEGAPPRDGVDFTAKGVETYIEKGLIKKADTIEELAQMMNIPSDKLAATISRYNELSKKGADEDFGKRAAHLSTIEKAPFYAARLSGLLLCTLNGLRINTDIQVLDKNMNPIPGLYAAGNDAGGFFAHNYPELLPGVALGRTMTFGRIAGINCAKQSI